MRTENPMFRMLLAATALSAALAVAIRCEAQLSVGGAAYDHLACYKIQEDLNFSALVKLQSKLEQLDVPSKCKVMGRSVSYCVPVRQQVERLRYRDGETATPAEISGADQGDGQLCYRMKCKADPIAGPLRFEDRFGQHALRNLSVVALCTSARLLPNTTTTTTTSTTIPYVDPCATVECESDRYCRPECDDTTLASCVPYKDEGDACGGFVPPCKQDLCKPGLECLTPPNIRDSPGLCVDPAAKGCERDSDCLAGEVCEAGPSPRSPNVCVPGCHRDDQCAEGQRCQELACLATPCAGLCVDENKAECTSDPDCGGGEVCEPGGPGYPGARVCVPGCRNDEACREGYHCQAAVCITTPCPSRCVEDPPANCGACISDSDCSQEGWRCITGDRCLKSCECPDCKVCAGNCVPPADAGVP